MIGPRFEYESESGRENESNYAAAENLILISRPHSIDLSITGAVR